MNRKVVLFQNTRSVIKAEKLLNISGIQIKLIPVPKDISAECGICIEVFENLNSIITVLNENEIQYEIAEF